MTQLYDLVLAPTGLKATQFIVLRAIAERGELPQWELAREHGVAVETLSRRLASLRKAAWVSLRISGARREHVYTLTEEGMRIYRAAFPYWQRAQNRLSEALQKRGANLAELIRMADIVAVAAQDAATLRTTNCAGEAVEDVSDAPPVKRPA